MLPLSPFSICNGPWHPLYSTHVLDSPHVQPLFRSSLVFLLVLNPQLYTPYISSPNHHLLFTAHAHTSAACFAAIPMLCHLYQLVLDCVCKLVDDIPMRNPSTNLAIPLDAHDLRWVTLNYRCGLH